MTTSPLPKRAKLSIQSDYAESTEAEPTTSKHTQNLGSLSPLERLPKEIVRSILEYAPETVFELRSTSRMLQSHVDQFAQLRLTIPLVEDLSFYGNEKGGVSGFEIFPDDREIFEIDSMSDDEEYDYEGYKISSIICMSMFISVRKASLFELRLKLRGPPINLIKRIKRNIDCGDKGDCNAYHLEFDTHLMAGVDREIWKYLLECMGKKIGKAVLFECKEGQEFATVFRLLEDFNFHSLTVTIGDLSDEAKRNITNAVVTHNVDKLSLSVDDVSASNKVNFLLELSSIVHSLHINQIQTPPYRRKFFFGIVDVDWAPTILDMFTRKLDKLHFENLHNQNFLWRTSADALVQNLPQLEKHLWFVSSCSTKKARRYRFNNFIIQSDGQGLEHRMLSIKHASRVNEPF